MYNVIGNTNTNYNIALYIRLSKEDIKEGENKDSASESIKNQQTFLKDYVKALGVGYNLTDIYIDDGFTGTNFNRPEFQRMLRDIENGKINMVVTKDLSRLGRDYIGTGEYIEKWFPAHNTRYISVTDNIDTFTDSAQNDIAPFKSILNDMYSKDLSKKIRTALTTMQKEGKWVGGCTPFGYKVDPNDKNHLVPDEQEAPIIKRIFSLYLEGKNINQIRDILNDEKVPTFSTTRGRNFKRQGKSGEIYGYWCNTTLKKILKNRLYTGDMIQNRRSRVSYKYRKVINNPKDKWIIVENTHEGLISKEDFNKVQELLPKQSHRNDKTEFHLLDGLLKCKECGHTIAIRNKREKEKYNYTVCNKYRKFKREYNLCTSHGFQYQKIEQGVLKTLNNLFNELDPYEINDTLEKKYNANEVIEKCKNKILKLENDIQKTKTNLDGMYLDKLSNKISEEMYNRIYEKLIGEINSKENQLEEQNSFLKEKELNAKNQENLINTIKDYLALKEPTREMIISLIKQIDISENGQIDIKFNFKELNIIRNNSFTY